MFVMKRAEDYAFEKHVEELKAFSVRPGARGGREWVV